MYARVYLYIGEILPPVIDYIGYIRSMIILIAIYGIYVRYV